MRFMVIRRADKSTEAGGPPSKALLDAMTKYHEDGAKAGIVLDGTGLQPSSKGARVKIAGGEDYGDRRPVRRDEGAHRRASR